MKYFDCGASGRDFIGQFYPQNSIASPQWGFKSLQNSDTSPELQHEEDDQQTQRRTKRIDDYLSELHEQVKNDAGLGGATGGNVEEE